MNPNYEPSAMARQTATLLRDMFSALVQSGFTESQALKILGTVLTASITGQQGGGYDGS